MNNKPVSRAYRDSTGAGLVCGIGIYEPRVLCMRDSPEIEKSYRVWNGMLRRAEPKYAKQYPSYAGTSVAPEFHRFADFSRWAMQQVGWGVEGHQLDKDLLSKDSRVYSPSTCVFLPMPINVLLTRGDRNRGVLPIGVKATGYGQFFARMKIDGVDTRLGRFQTIDDAFQAYKAAKEANIKRLAEQYKDQIDPRAYAALLAYQVEITD